MAPTLIPRSAWRVVERDGRKIVKVRCPFCNTEGVLNHEIEADGTVYPSVECGEIGCAFHVTAKLEGWDLGPLVSAP